MRLLLLTALCMTLFASNSLLCRAAIKTFGLEPLFYTAIRGIAAALMLWLVCSLKSGYAGSLARRESMRWLWQHGRWVCVLFLACYMFFFSLAFVNLPAAVGALLLFSSVQFSMLGWGLWHGERLDLRQTTGFAVAVIGLVWLLSSDFMVPSLLHALFMCLAGVCWGGYSLLGKSVSPALQATAGNFLRCLPLTLLALVLAFLVEQSASLPAVLCAVASGALTSGLGYALWYGILPRYSIVSSSIMQLSVPAIAAILAVPLLGEAVTLRLVVCSMLILGGIALTLRGGQRA